MLPPQRAVRAMAQDVDVVLGAQDNSNCIRLREATRANGRPVCLINGPEDIDHAWLDKVERVGITAGASKPEGLGTAVVEALRPHRVSNVSVAEENVAFVLPSVAAPGGICLAVVAPGIDRSRICAIDRISIPACQSAA
jgi:4-hydroxy-3-methylbut-2-enyl diphosphate reductase